ncbi:MAG: transglutaminase, partial [Acidimicrobiales bacterium]
MSRDPLSATVARRDVSARIEAEVADETTIILAVAVAGDYETGAEQLSVSLDGVDLMIDSIKASRDGRLHVSRKVGSGRLVVSYEATVTGFATPSPATDREWVQYLRPSRYCESDRLGPFARAEFAGLE